MIREIALREIVTRGRTRAFKVITGVLLLAAIAGPVAAALWPDGEDTREVTVGITEQLGSARPAIEALGAQLDLDVEFESVDGFDGESVDTALVDGELDVVIISPSALRWDETVDTTLQSAIVAGLQQTQAIEELAEVGLSPDDVGAAFTPVEIIDEFVTPSTLEDDVASGLAFAGLLLGFIAAQFVGQLAMMGVIEEKSTGVIEVLLGHLRPRAMLAGKVIGISSLAILQILIVLAGLTAGLVLTQAIDVPSSLWRFLPVLLVTLIGGTIIYAALFALLGSLISRQEDASQVMLPAMVPLFVGYFAGQFFAFDDASGLLARVLTFVPFTGPMILPVRVAREAIGPIEFVLALAVLVVTVWAIVRLAGRVYEFTLLRAGTRVPWSEVVRMLLGR